MNYIKKLYIPVIGAIVSMIVFQLSETIGVWINSFSPCIEVPENSAHCYLGIELQVAAVAAIFFIICVILILVKIVKIVKRK